MKTDRQVGQWLTEAGTALQESLASTDGGQAVDAVALRILQRRLEGAWPTADTPLGGLVSFYVPLFIQDLFSNLFGDTPYFEAITGSRRRVLEVASRSLTSMGMMLEEGNERGVALELAAIADIYREEIRGLNRNLEGGERGVCA